MFNGPHPETGEELVVEDESPEGVPGPRPPVRAVGVRARLRAGGDRSDRREAPRAGRPPQAAVRRGRERRSASEDQQQSGASRRPGRGSRPRPPRSDRRDDRGDAGSTDGGACPHTRGVREVDGRARTAPEGRWGRARARGRRARHPTRSGADRRARTSANLSSELEGSKCSPPATPTAPGGCRRRRQTSDVGAASDAVSVSRMNMFEPDDLLDSLREENEALLVRVAHLEATTDEYRRQMEGLLTSSSWRITAPLRSFAAGLRLARRRIRQVPERLARSPGPCRLLHRRALSARGAATRRARDGCQSVAGASRARDGSSAAAASRLAVGRPGARGRTRLLPGGLVRHRGPARPDSGAVRPRRLAGRRPHRGARAARSPSGYHTR